MSAMHKLFYLPGELWIAENKSVRRMGHMTVNHVLVTSPQMFTDFKNSFTSNLSDKVIMK